MNTLETRTTNEGGQLYPVIRLKGDKVILKLGSESCHLTINDLEQLIKTARSRIEEVKAKERRDPEYIKFWQEHWDRTHPHLAKPGDNIKEINDK